VYYDKIMGKTRAMKAISEAEKHQKSLLKRYEERTKMKDYEEQAKKLLAKDSRNDEGLHDSQALIPGLTNTVPRLTAEQLYSLIKSAHPSEFLILDVRPQKEFTKNHILHASCINIPEELLEHGVSVSNIERRLQEKTRVIWRQRGSKSCLVIVDKSSRVTDLSPSSKTFQFKEAIYNNDSSCRLSHEPFLLDGGFDGWLWHYPSLATKSELPTVSLHAVHISYMGMIVYLLRTVSSNTNLSETIDFSALDFPDLPTEEHTKPQPPAPNLETPKINDVYPSLPNSTATSKPSMTPYQQGQVNGGEFTTPQAPKANHLPEKKPDSMVTHGPMPTVPTAVAGHTPQRPIDEHSPVVRQIPGNQQQPYLPNGTSQPSSQHYKGSPIPSNQTAVPGVVGGQSSLTGTSSQAPTVTSPPNITQQGWQPSVNQGQISGLPRELAEQFSILVRVANSGQYKYLSPSDFKRTVGKIKSSFSGFDQQDSQEFLALMMDKLHEDVNTILNKPFLKTPGDDIEPSRAAEMSWANHKMRNQSFLVELFDGLFMSTVRCLVCQKKSVTFETFSNLTLPLPGQGSHCSLK
ncbi:hypothetical protein QZH41_011010, partial [Actinostola sp. cb2023]